MELCQKIVLEVLGIFICSHVMWLQSFNLAIMTLTFLIFSAELYQKFIMIKFYSISCKKAFPTCTLVSKSLMLTSYKTWKKCILNYVLLTTWDVGGFPSQPFHVKITKYLTPETDLHHHKWKVQEFAKNQVRVQFKMFFRPSCSLDKTFFRDGTKC